MTTTLQIPDLPRELRLVPPSPTHEDDPGIDAWRADYARWKQGVLAYRRRRWRACGERVDGITGKPLPEHAPEIDPNEVQVERLKELVRCARDRVYFRAIWCATFESRGGFNRVKGWQPFIPYPFQVRWSRWYERIKQLSEESDEPALGPNSKPRTMGVSNTSCNDVLHDWIWEEHFFAKLVSRKEDLVDSPSLDALMTRITAQFDWKRGQPAGNPLHIPRWMWPAGFDPAVHKQHLILRNPENGNEINGESTNATTGRGGRATIALVDEASFIPNLKHVLGSMTETVAATILVSSESVEVGTDFLDIVSEFKQTGNDNLLEIDWWEHPHYDARWLELKRKQYEDQGNLPAFYREILRDAGAGLTAWAYPKARDLGWIAEHVGDFPYVTGSPVWIGFDPGNDDETAINVLCRDMVSGRYRLFAAYANSGQEPEFYASLLAAVEDPRFRYNTAEEAFMDVMRRLPLPQAMYGDPYGNNRTSGRDTWYVKMTKWWKEQEDASDKPVRYRIPIVLGWKKDQRSLQGRRTALMKLLDRLDFHDDPYGQVKETLRAVQNQKWDVAENRSAEQKHPRHDHRWTHRTSALEYFAVNREFAPIDGQLPDRTPYDAVA